MFKKAKLSTPSLRHTFILVKNVSKKPLLKKLIKTYNRPLGRSRSSGIISSHKGGGVKKKYRTLNLTRNDPIEGIICSLEHDPYRGAFVMAVFDRGLKKFSYSLSPEHLSVGDLVVVGKEFVPIKNGNAAPVKEIPQGSIISNVPLKVGGIGKIARAAGSYCILKNRGPKNCAIELMSGEIRRIPSDVHVTLGRLSNGRHFLEELGKAGRSRWKGRRPKTRGVAMNPVDHPNGGGEGKKSGLGKTPWGKPGKGQKTSRQKITSWVVKKR